MNSPIDKVWEFYTDVKHLEIVTPKEMKLKIINVTSEKLTQGSEIWLEAKLMIFRTSWHSVIRSLKPYQYLDEMVRGPFKKWTHLHMFHSSDKSEIGDQKGIVATLKQYVRETRKFGIGWMFVSTSLADLDESIVSQTGVRIFGYGLNMGSELERLKDCVTDQTDLDFYLAFPNPLNSLEEEYRIYPFMITGPCSPFCSSPFCY